MLNDGDQTRKTMVQSRNHDREMKVEVLCSRIEPSP